jgi:3D (Asp-Asp-Asp) domain-containing protein
MATGRTVFQKYNRVYVNGYDLSGYSRDIGPLTTEFDVTTDAAMSDAIKGGLPELANINVGTLNGFLDNTATSGLHVLANTATGTKNVLVAVGIRAAPAQGDPAFCAVVEQKNYLAPVTMSGMNNVSIEYAGTSVTSTIKAYQKAWGLLLRPLTATTAVNAAAGVDHPGAAETTAGAYMMYQVTAGNGNATIKVQDSADNSSFSDVASLTSGVIDCSAATSGVIAIGTTATVRRYLRWQIVLDTATTVTFALACVRG